MKKVLKSKKSHKLVKKKTQTSDKLENKVKKVKKMSQTSQKKVTKSD